jgi:DNA polymerase III subunit chi
VRIDFFFNVEHRLHYACRVVRKARAAGKSVLAYASDADRLARFDNALWTFSALDFLPHVYADAALAAQTPIVLSQASGSAPRDVLLNLDDAAPAGFAQWFGGFERVIEVVSRDDADRRAARERVRCYRDAGLVPALHDMAAEQ